MSFLSNHSSTTTEGDVREILTDVGVHYDSTTLLTSSGSDVNDHDTTVGVPSGLAALIVFIIVIVIIIVIRKRMNNDVSKSESELDMDSIEENTTFITNDHVRKSMDTKAVEYCLENEPLKCAIKDYIIHHSKISLGNILGKGQYGCVYEARLCKESSRSDNITTLDGSRLHNDHPPDGDRVAVKTLRGSQLDAEIVESFLTEGLIMKDFKHEHVLGFLGVSFSEDNIPMIILPFMSNGNLKKYIINPQLQITVRDLLGFALQVAQGMRYLESQKFVHRDLAARNCMLDDNLVVKIADFGLSRDIYTKEYYSSEDKKAKLPVKWMAVESLTKNIYTTKSDVWSYGVLVWELMTRGVTPYPDISNWDIRNYVIAGRRLPQPEACPSQIYSMMQMCWSHDAKERPCFIDLVHELEQILSCDTTDGDEDYETLYVNVEHSLQTT